VTASLDAPAATRKFELVPVRRRDVRRLREYGPPLGVPLPAKHGSRDDPRYPSRHTFRYNLGFTLDLLLHIACAIGVTLAFARNPALSDYAILAAPASFIAVSILHRIVVQRAVHTTLGKALTGLRLVRDDSGAPPTLWSLTKAWLFGTVMLILSVLAG
jgi:hypothetical protein